MRICAVEESSTCEGAITTMTLEGPIYRGSEIVLSQHMHAELMVFFPHNADAEITYSLTLSYPTSHALKMTQVEVTAIATTTVVEARWGCSTAGKVANVHLRTTHVL